MMLQGQELAGAVLIPCYPALGHLVRGLAAQVPEWERETDNRDQTLAGSTMNTTVLEPRSAFDLSLSPLKTLTLFTKMADHNLEITVAQLVAVAVAISHTHRSKVALHRTRGKGTGVTWKSMSTMTLVLRCIPGRIGVRNDIIEIIRIGALIIKKTIEWDPKVSGIYLGYNYAILGSAFLSSLFSFGFRAKYVYVNVIKLSS